MKQTAVEFLIEQIKSKADNLPTNTKENRMAKGIYVDCLIMARQVKEMEENLQLEMVHKFAFDYTYNYKGEKTIYEWIPEWFEEYKRLEEKLKNK